MGKFAVLSLQFYFLIVVLVLLSCISPRVIGVSMSKPEMEDTRMGEWLLLLVSFV